MNTYASFNTVLKKEILMSTNALQKLPGILIVIVVLTMGIYLIYAVIKKKPIADPDNPNNIIASFPVWPKSLHRQILVLIGVLFSVSSLCVIFAEIFRWLKR